MLRVPTGGRASVRHLRANFTEHKHAILSSTWKLLACTFCGGLLLVVFHFRVHRPDVRLIGAAGKDVVDSGHGRQHRMVLVVVLVHPISAHQEQVFIFLDKARSSSKRSYAPKYAG